MKKNVIQPRDHRRSASREGGHFCGVLQNLSRSNFFFFFSLFFFNLHDAPRTRRSFLPFFLPSFGKRKFFEMNRWEMIFFL